MVTKSHRRASETKGDKAVCVSVGVCCCKTEKDRTRARVSTEGQWQQKTPPPKKHTKNAQMPFRPPRVSIAFVIWYEPEHGFGLLSFLFLPLFHFISLPLLGSHFCLFSPSSCFLFFPFIPFSFSSCFPLTSFLLFFPLSRPAIFFSFPFLLSIYLNLFSHSLSSQCSSLHFSFPSRLSFPLCRPFPLISSPPVLTPSLS